MRVIALKLISGAECDTVLKIAKLTIANQDTALKSQAKTIDKQEVRYKKIEGLVDQCNVEKEGLKKEIKKAKRRLTWTKVGWAATAVILTITTVLALIH